jgi:hypothetical protein
MTPSPKTPIWKRAAIRGVGAAAILFAALEGLILTGKTAKLDTGEALTIALTSGAVYAGLWSVFAMMVAKMLANVESRAREDKE